VDAHDQTPDIDRDRRRFLQTAGLAIGAGSLAMAGSAQAQTRSTREDTTQEEMSGRPVTGAFIWKFNSPTWKFSTETYAKTAAAFNNPDYVAIVIGNYRWRQSLAPSDPEYAAFESRLQQAPAIAVPTITIDGEYDPFTPAGDGAAYRAHFTGKYEHRDFRVGHNVPQEAPREFARAVIDVDHF
jgi:pimeloyl-ACP methyl ester carboxylesterase